MEYINQQTKTLYQELNTISLEKFKKEAKSRYEEIKKFLNHECSFDEGVKWLLHKEEKCHICFCDFNEAEENIENEECTETTAYYWSKSKKYCNLEGEYAIFTCTTCKLKICHSCRQNAVEKSFDINEIGLPKHQFTKNVSIGEELGNIDLKLWVKEAKSRITEFKSSDSNHKCNFDIKVDWASEAQKTSCNICCFNNFNLFEEERDDDYYWTDSEYWDEHEKYSFYYNGTLYICSECKVRMCSACREVFEKSN